MWSKVWSREPGFLFLIQFQILTGKVGGGDVQVYELPDAAKTVLVQWSHVKIDLNELARLRWIKNKTVPEIMKEMGWGRTCVQGSMRTLRKRGLSLLNLSFEEKKQIFSAMKKEISNLKETQPRFKSTHVNKQFRSRGKTMVAEF